MKRLIKGIPALLSAMFLALPKAEASFIGTGLPWEKPLNTIAQSLQTTTATAIFLIALAFCAFLWSMAQSHEAMKRFAGIGIGISVVALAPTVLAIFGLSASLM